MTGKGKIPWNKDHKSERFVTNDGYVHVWVPEGTPGRYATGYMPEHRKLMADWIGRPLLGKETVHHKNGVRSDNSRQNLELWVTPPKPGQRVEDLCDWAESILATYRPERLVDGEAPVQGL